MNLQKDTAHIIQKTLAAVLPDRAVIAALQNKQFGPGKIYVVAVGKAAWQMAKAAADFLQEKITAGVIITKYDHIKGDIPGMRGLEAGHPVPDENSFRATQEAMRLVEDLKEEDTVLLLLSGGGSAVFEKPLISGEELKDINRQLLFSGADIVEMNTIRKRLSGVKGGRFAKWCEPAQIYCVVLSDVLGDPLDMIASGPAYPDLSTSQQAVEIAQKYQLRLSEQAWECLKTETPKTAGRVETVVAGNVRELCRAAEAACQELGYETIFLTDWLACEARQAGSFMASIAKSHQNTKKSLAFIAGGETVVHVSGKGLGGRNQELALAAANEISGLKDTAVFSIGSDGTDGPTDAAGGYADQDTKETLEEKGIRIYDALKNNDAYHALKACGGLLITGATGTNVNDVTVLLIKR